MMMGTSRHVTARVLTMALSVVAMRIVVHTMVMIHVAAFVALAARIVVHSVVLLIVIVTLFEVMAHVFCSIRNVVDSICYVVKAMLDIILSLVKAHGEGYIRRW